MNHAFLMSGARGAAALALALGVSAAAAQQVGTYTGTTADGFTISLQVAQDPGSGIFYVDGIDAGYTLLCAKTGDSQVWEIGWNGPLARINSSGSASARLYDVTAFDDFRMTFSGATDVSGTVGAGLPEYAGTIRSTQGCTSMAETFTATFVAGAPVAAPVAAGTRRLHIHVDGDGRVLSKDLRTAR